MVLIVSSLELTDTGSCDLRSKNMKREASTGKEQKTGVEKCDCVALLVVLS